VSGSRKQHKPERLQSQKITFLDAVGPRLIGILVADEHLLFSFNSALYPNPGSERGTPV
jgi:hypothetical protein